MLDDAEAKQVFVDDRSEDEVRGPGSMRAFERYHERILNRYEQLTGFRETNINAVYHHLISLYGCPCVNCGKPLRSPRATRCAACGVKVQAV